MLLIQNQKKQTSNKFPQNKQMKRKIPPATQQQPRYLKNSAGSEMTDFCLHKYFGISKVEAKNLLSSNIQPG